MAWNKLRSDIVGGPIEIRNAADVVARLNRAEQSDEDLAPGDFYAAAGFDRDGIAATIRDDMARLFPSVPAADLPTDPNGLTAYGFLRAEVPFAYPFFEARKGFPFAGKDSVGGVGFAIENDGPHPARGQVEVLYAHRDLAEEAFRFDEYALDLCKNSTPNQIVLAVIQPRATLAELLATLEEKMTAASRHHERFPSMDTLRVPNLHFRIAHHYGELEGQLLLNPKVHGLYLDTALQTIEFKLDRGGAELSSSAVVHAKGGPREFHFDRPFLLYMKKRDARHPFLVLWIENDELLQTRR
jgi:hypothetical protein